MEEGHAGRESGFVKEGDTVHARAHSLSENRNDKGNDGMLKRSEDEGRGSRKQILIARRTGRKLPLARLLRRWSEKMERRGMSAADENPLHQKKPSRDAASGRKQNLKIMEAAPPAPISRAKMTPSVACGHCVGLGTVREAFARCHGRGNAQGRHGLCDGRRGRRISRRFTRLPQGLLEEFGGQAGDRYTDYRHGFAGNWCRAAMGGLKPLSEFMTFNFAHAGDAPNSCNSAAKNPIICPAARCAARLCFAVQWCGFPGGCAAIVQN